MATDSEKQETLRIDIARIEERQKSSAEEQKHTRNNIKQLNNSIEELAASFDKKIEELNKKFEENMKKYVLQGEFANIKFIVMALFGSIALQAAVKYVFK